MQGWLTVLKTSFFHEFVSQPGLLSRSSLPVLPVPKTSVTVFLVSPRSIATPLSPLNLTDASLITSRVELSPAHFTPVGPVAEHPRKTPVRLLLFVVKSSSTLRLELFSQTPNLWLELAVKLSRMLSSEWSRTVPLSPELPFVVKST